LEVELAWPSALLHVLVLALIAAVAIWDERVGQGLRHLRIRGLLMVAIGQGVGFSERYGLVVLMGNIALGTYIPEAIWRGTILHLLLLITSAYALGLTIRAPHLT